MIGMSLSAIPDPIAGLPTGVRRIARYEVMPGISVSGMTREKMRSKLMGARGTVSVSI